MKKQPTPGSNEFLEVDGRGGFVCGCVDGQVRRRHHGWWMARRPPRDRLRLLAGWQLHEEGDTGDFPLTAIWSNKRGAWQRPEWPAQLEPLPFPTWEWPMFGGAPISLDLHLARIATPCLSFSWQLQDTVEQSPNSDFQGMSLVFAPLLVAEPNPAFSLGTPLLATVEGVPIYMHLEGDAEIAAPAEFLEEVELETERDCSDEWTEPLWRGPALRFLLTGSFGLRFSAGRPVEDEELDDAWHTEHDRRLQLRVAPLPEDDPRSPAIAHAADQFIVRDGVTGLPTILAGYPWFTDWGRDTMIALPGLCLRTGRQEEARQIIRHFLHHQRDGLIPNIFPEAEPPKYNTVDGTLWLVDAAFRAWTSEEIAAEPELLAALRSIIDHYQQGTGEAIAMDPEDGLIAAGTPGTQLTWMDIKVMGEVPTPRHGKPVEIQGLWYNALRLMAGAEPDEARAQAAADLAERVAASFAARFAVEGAVALADVVDRDAPGDADLNIRPNQVIPFALAHNVVPEEQRPQVLRAVAKHLLTPRGIRSLAPSDPRYRNRYAGNLLARDRAYHQGTCWFWPLWPYAAGVQAERDAVPELFADLRRVRDELLHHWQHEGCVLQVNEIADADPPHTPRGCFAQAWSTAALIEVLLAAEANTEFGV